MREKFSIIFSPPFSLETISTLLLAIALVALPNSAKTDEESSRITKEVFFEVASQDQGYAPNRILIADANVLYRFPPGVQDTFGTRVVGAQFVPLDRAMPPNGQPGYFGYLSAEKDPDFENRILLHGAMYKGVTPFHAKVVVTYEGESETDKSNVHPRPTPAPQATQTGMNVPPRPTPAPPTQTPKSAWGQGGFGYVIWKQVGNAPAFQYGGSGLPTYKTKAEAEAAAKQMVERYEAGPNLPGTQLWYEIKP